MTSGELSGEAPRQITKRVFPGHFSWQQYLELNRRSTPMTLALSRSTKIDHQEVFSWPFEPAAVPGIKQEKHPNDLSIKQEKHQNDCTEMSCGGGGPTTKRME